MNRVGTESQHAAAGILFVLAWMFWFHRWVPALAIAAVLLWVVFHDRLEDGLADLLRARWRRAWRSRLVAITLLSGSALVFTFAEARTDVKALPIALDAIALSVVLFGSWWKRLPVPPWLGGDVPAPSTPSQSRFRSRR